MLKPGSSRTSTARPARNEGREKASDRQIEADRSVYRRPTTVVRRIRGRAPGEVVCQRPMWNQYPFRLSSGARCVQNVCQIVTASTADTGFSALWPAVI